MYRLDVANMPANLLVPWYLMMSYLYYVRNVQVIPDTTYDLLCKRLLDEFDSVEHQHKHLADTESLYAGTAYSIKEYPTIVKSSAMMLVERARGLWKEWPFERSWLSLCTD